VVVVSTGSYIVNCTVDSTQVNQVKVGDQATITVAGSTSDVFGTVGSIGLLATTTSGVSSFPVVVDVTGSPSGLFGGSSATVSIITQELQDVLVVPTTAIHYSGNGTTVTLDSGGNKVTQTVTIGAASAGQTQVTSGLSAGDKVYVTEVTFHGATGTGGAGLFGRTGGGGAGFGGGGGGFGGGGGGFGAGGGGGGGFGG
jgi:multidrug efflux pump subunit AcrA (membrane-fusion protein)